MTAKLRVVLQVAEEKTPSFLGVVPKNLLDFTGETELSLSELRTILSSIVTGDASSFAAVQDVAPLVPLLTEEEAETQVAAEVFQPAEIFTAEAPAKTRKSPRPKTKLVCHKCGRPFKGYGVYQKYCHKSDCSRVVAEKVAAANLLEKQAGPSKRQWKYPETRVAPTPKTPAVCARCGRDYMAYTSRQKYCNKPDCHMVAFEKTHAQTRSQKWSPQATIVAGEGVVAGAV